MLEPNNSHRPLIGESYQYSSPNDKEEQTCLSNNAISSISSSSEQFSVCTKTNKNTQHHGGFISNLRKIFPSLAPSLRKEEDVELAELDKVCLQGKQIMKNCENITQANSSSDRQACRIRLTPKQAIVGGLLLGGAAGSATMYFARKNNSTSTDVSDVIATKMTPPMPPFYDQYNSTDAGNGYSDQYREIDKLTDVSTVKSLKFCDISNEEYEKNPKIINTPPTPDLKYSTVDYLGSANENRSKRNIKELFIDNSLIKKNIIDVILQPMRCEKIRSELHTIYNELADYFDLSQDRTVEEKNIRFLMLYIRRLERFIIKWKEDKLISNEDAYFLKEDVLGGLWRIAANVGKEDMVFVDTFVANFDKQDDIFPYKKKREEILNKSNNKNEWMLTNKNNSNNVFVHINKRVNLPKNNEHVDKESTTEIDDVKIEYLLECYDERENLTFTDKMRVVSRTLMSPIASVINEGSIAFKYGYLSKGCEDDGTIFKIASGIESFMNFLFSTNVVYANLLAGSKVAAYLINLIADQIDKKNINIDSVEGLLDEMNSLFVGLFLTLPTSHIEQIEKGEEVKEIEEMLEGIKIKNGKIYIETEQPPKLVEVVQKYGHFFDKNDKNFLDYTDHWVIKADHEFDFRINKMITNAYKALGDKSEITYIKNSSPEFYNDALILANKDGLFVPLLITERGIKFTSVKEIKFNDRDYRYLVQKNINKIDGEHLIPIVFNGGRWRFEGETSPALDEAIVGYIKENEYVKNKLVSKNIKHGDVSPMTLGRDIQFDSEGNHYLKIDNQYFLLKMDNSGSSYIEGDLDILPLANYKSNKVGGEYHVRRREDGIISMSRVEIIDHQSKVFENGVFLDETIINEIKTFDTGLLQDINNENIKEMSHSTRISGAINFENEDYFNIGNSLVKVRKMGYDAYHLGDDKYMGQSVVVYKNDRSNTYYLQKSLTKNGAHEYKESKNRSCLSKRQVIPLCDLPYSQSTMLKNRLKINKEHAVKIDNPEEILEPLDGMASIYKKKGSEHELYFLYKDNLYFHAIDAPHSSSEIAPAYIYIRGKKENGEIDESVAIADVCLVKKYDSEELLMSMPSEAQELILGITPEVSNKLLKWQSNIFNGKKITFNDFEKLPSRLESYKEIPEVEKLFNKSGKKIIYPLNHVNDVMNSEMGKHFPGNGEVTLLTLGSAMEKKEFNTITDVCNTALKDAISALKLSISKKESKVRDYIINNVGISGKKAVEFFLKTINKKIERISTVLNEKSSENILLAVRDVRENVGMEGGVVAGVTMPSDPLDRIILNAFIIPEHFSTISNPIENVNEKKYYINLIKDTIIHEAAHATGDKHDYAYIKTDNSGNLVPIKNAIVQLEMNIARDIMDKKFIDLSKIYLSSHPAYREFLIDNLVTSHNLQLIFKKDPYLKGLLLLNNPDTVAIMVREISEL
ncbi:hypothetical protein JFY74_10635 [Pectobacterium carotovorum]|nr:hypothetical protein JFY74_10635 [Pectobacterium carotovorum]